jgi:hypothetical protein
MRDKPRTVFLNALPLNAIPYSSFTIICRRVRLEALRDLVEDSVVESYIRHEATLKVISSVLGVDLKPSSGLYSYSPGDAVVVVALKKPVRGQEVVEVKQEDLDVLLCLVSQGSSRSEPG